MDAAYLEDKIRELREENARLRAKLARVVEAGNEMADWIGDEQHLQVRVWRAALAAAKGEE